MALHLSLTSHLSTSYHNKSELFYSKLSTFVKIKFCTEGILKLKINKKHSDIAIQIYMKFKVFIDIFYMI